MAKESNTHNHRHGKSRTPRKLWTQPDQDQDDHRKPHCCGVCQDSPGGDQGQGLI